MIQRTLALLILAFLLIGATPAAIGDYAIVDDNPAPVRGTYPTVQAAIESGAEWIEVRAGEYAGFTVNRPNVTIVMQGARFHNTGVTVWIEAAAVGTAITGDWEIYGDADGTVLGDFFTGTGVLNSASYVTLEGLRCTNLLAFCVLNPDVSAHHVTIDGCKIQNVATSPTPQLLAGTAILFINGSSQNVVRNCYISGQSQAIGTWYGASHNQIHDNHLQDNYGWIEINSPRSAIEDYGLDGAVNVGNQFYGNYVDGSNGSAFELADELRDVVVRSNTVHNVTAAFWMGGSGDNKSLNATIEDNYFYGHSGVVSNWFSGTGTISGNHFEEWESEGVNNTGVIYVPSDGLGDVKVIDNAFKNTGRVIRYSAPTGDLWFIGNTIDTDTPTWILYFADTANGGHVIADNRIVAPNSGFALYANADTQMTVRDNTIEGAAIWDIGQGSVIEGNTIYCPVGGWTGLVVSKPNQVARNNRLFCDNTPMVIGGGATGALIERNFVARNDGSATTVLPVCGPTNTCVRNWTVGQAPPP